MTFVDFDICHRMASLRKIILVNLAYCLKVYNGNINIYETVRAETKMFVDFDIAIE